MNKLSWHNGNITTPRNISVILQRRSDRCFKSSAKRAAKFANNADQTGWESLAKRRMVSRLCTLFKAYTGRRAWEAIGGWLLRPCYLSREDHNWKIRSRKKRTDIGKYSFLNRSIINWNQLSADLLALRKLLQTNELDGGLNVNTCIYCVLFVWLLYTSLYFIILGTYFIVLGMYYCMFIVLGTYYCMFAIYCIVLYCCIVLLYRFCLF
jgi:hypothetical protein